MPVWKHPNVKQKKNCFSACLLVFIDCILKFNLLNKTKRLTEMSESEMRQHLLHWWVLLHQSIGFPLSSMIYTAGDITISTVVVVCVRAS